MCFEIQNNSWQGGIPRFLTPDKVSEIATRIGLSTKASLTPNEYNCLLKMTTTLALEKLNGNSGDSSQDLREKVVPIVDELLNKQCKRDNTSQEVLPQVIQDLWASVLWRLTSLFYKE